MNVQPWSTVGLGSDNSVVSGIQYLLRAHGHALAVDGQFGPVTAAAVTAFQSSHGLTAVTAFQSSHGLTADGIVGPQTWAHLPITTSVGSSGDAVRAVQQFGLLRWPGDDPLAVDGAYGPVTAEHVTFFQESWGLTQDGAVGPETWSFLSTFVPGPRPWPLVKQGATQTTNWRVLAAQHLLRAQGATIAVDGAFGPVTDAAVRQFQTMFAPPSDGIVGPITWKALTLRIFD